VGSETTRFLAECQPRAAGAFLAVLHGLRRL